MATKHRKTITAIPFRVVPDTERPQALSLSAYMRGTHDRATGHRPTPVGTERDRRSYLMGYQA